MKKVSIILIDWSVRESFHSIDFLNEQTVPRSEYEIIWVEYYNKRPKEIEDMYSEGNIDKWLLLDKSGQYFKHQLFNEGILASEGEIIVIPDSDAIFKPTFIEAILETFAKYKDERIVLYLDEIRSSNREFYPYRSEYTWNKIMESSGLINWDKSRHTTKGLASNYDTLHSRNYGACFCGRKEDIIDAGGFDEHSSHHCFICGVYELGFRLVNKGFREIWHESEFLLHVWHPWVDGKYDSVGHHDGLLVNSTAVEILKSKRTCPLVENEDIKKVRTDTFGNNCNKSQAERFNARNHCDTNSMTEDAFTSFYNKIRLFYGYIFSRVRFKGMMVITPYELPYMDVTDYKSQGINNMMIGNPLHNAFGYLGRVVNMSIFNYDIIYRTYGYESMLNRLTAESVAFKPDAIIYIPLKVDRNSLGNEKVEPDKNTLRKLKQYFQCKLYFFIDSADEFDFDIELNDIFDHFVFLCPNNSLIDKVECSKVLYSYPLIDYILFFKSKKEKNIDVCFWGSVPIGSTREENIRYLRENGIQVVTRLHRVSSDEYAEILKRSKIVLSIKGEHEKPGSIRKRTFEILAGGSLLMEDSPTNTKNIFVRNKDYIEFDDKHDLLQKVQYYLTNEQQRIEIAESGYSKINECYNTRDMFDYLFDRDTRGSWNVVFILLKLCNLIVPKGWLDLFANISKRAGRIKQRIILSAVKPNKVLIFGASVSGKEVFDFCRSIGIEVISFVDNSLFLQQSGYLGCRVYPADSIPEHDYKEADAVIIASLGRKEEIRAQLKALSFYKLIYDCDIFLNTKQ